MSRSCLHILTIILNGLLLWNCIDVNAATYYVATSGSSDSYPGTISQPWATWQKAFNSAQAGDTVFFRGGVWYPTSFVVYNGSGPGHSGTYSNPICYFNYPGETPVLDLSHYSYTISAAGLDIRNVTYVKFRGLTIRNNKQRVVNQWIAGLQFYQCGNLWVDQMVEYGSNGYGIWFSGFDTLYLTNCDSYNNLDSLSTERGNRADGFQISAGGSETDTFKYAVITGNRAWNNCDDGMEISISKQFEVYNNWMFNNGKYEYGAGVGFKFGPSNVRTPGKRKFHHNLAAFNKGPAFADQNLTDIADGPVSEISNNTSYKCGFGFTSDPNVFDCNSGYAKVIYRNNLVYKSTYSEYLDQIYLTACNYSYPSYAIQNHNTWIPISELPFWEYNDSVTVTDADFKSLDSAQLKWQRKPDGSLPDITFLTLAESSDLIDAGTEVGLAYIGAAPDIGYDEYKIPVTNIVVTGAGGLTSINTDNGTLQMLASITPASATNKTVAWSVINGTGKASISSTGLVTAISNGTVTIRATANDGSGVYGQLQLTISNQTYVYVTGITVAGAGGVTTINRDNGTLQLNASVIPSNADLKTVTWSIADGADRAYVNAVGLVSAIANGTTTVRATANDGSGIYGQLQVVISNQFIPVSSIGVTGAGGVTSITQDNGTLQLVASINPANATNKNITWSVINGTGQAAISSSGLVTAIADGTVTARATSTDGSGTYGALTITISNQRVLVSSINITSANGESEITTPGGTLQLSAEVLPTNATYRNVLWSLQNNTGLATVNSDGMVTALDDGTVTVTALATDGSGISDDFQIVISNQVYVFVSSITVTSENDRTTITEPMGTLQLYAEVLPSNATNKAFTWGLHNISGNGTISSDGLVTAISDGLLYIVAKSKENPTIFGSMVITVSNQPVSLSDENIHDVSYIMDDGILHIRTNNISNLNGIIRVVDITGRTLITQDMAGQIEIRMPEARGLYFIQFIFNDNRVWTRKIVL